MGSHHFFRRAVLPAGERQGVPLHDWMFEGHPGPAFGLPGGVAGAVPAPRPAPPPPAPVLSVGVAGPVGVAAVSFAPPPRPPPLPPSPSSRSSPCCGPGWTGLVSPLRTTLDWSSTKDGAGFWVLAGRGNTACPILRGFSLEGGLTPPLQNIPFQRAGFRPRHGLCDHWQRHGRGNIARHFKVCCGCRSGSRIPTS